MRFYLVAALVFGACGGADSGPHDLVDVTDGTSGEVVGYMELGCAEGFADTTRTCDAYDARNNVMLENCGGGGSSGVFSDYDGLLGCCVLSAAGADDGLPIAFVFAECN